MRWSTRPPQDPQPYVRWFAWHPVKLDAGEWAWLETVERRVYYPFETTYAGACYLYRVAHTQESRHA